MALRTNDNGKDRDMTADEEVSHLANSKIIIEDAKTNLKAEEARNRKRQEVLDRLGITYDELKIILS